MISKTVAMLLEKEFPTDLRVMNEATALRNAGIRVVIFCLNFGSLKPIEEIEDGIFAIRNAIPQHVFNKIHSTVEFFPFYNRWWKRFIRSWNVSFDAIHVHDLPLARVGWQLAEKAGVKWVLDLHENYPAALKIWSFSRTWPGRWIYRQKGWRRYERTAVKHADRAIVVTEEAMDRFIESGFEPEHFVVVSNTPDLETMRSISFEEKAGSRFRQHLNMVFTGGLGLHRGLEVVIKRLPDLHGQIPNLKLWLVGDGKERPSLESLARHCKVEDSIEFTGWLCFSEAMKIVANSDIALLPHLRTEHTETTIPHKLFQYMYLKKPVVASDCTPIRRILDETGSGLLFSTQDPKTLDSCVLRLREKPLRDELGMNGHKAVKTTWNWQNSSKNLVKIYHEFFKEK
ncbi:glycosyltransferase [candidate division KSB1 bacterium]|nr:glycosyltransferase [candidate division KSB1 bacterium]